MLSLPAFSGDRASHAALVRALPGLEALKNVSIGNSMGSAAYRAWRKESAVGV